MRKYELSLTSNYVLDWTVSDAVRELFQNAIDQQANGHDMSYKYDESTNKLVIISHNSKLKTNTLLLGNTTKSDDNDSIGQFGEGYKIATLVLLRLGKNIVFYNDGANETWRPKMVKFKKYGGEKILTFFTYDSISPKNDLVISISGITLDEYEEICERNLHMQNPSNMVSTQYGEILLDDKYKGILFVNGLFIKDEKNLRYGYNIKPKYIKINRDRKMVETFDILWVTSQMIIDSKDENIILEASKHIDSQYVKSFMGYNRIDKPILDTALKQFRDEHGEKAVPVTNQDDINNINDKYEDAVPVIVSETTKLLITSSNMYTVNATPIQEDDEPTIKERLVEWLCRYDTLLSTTAVDEFKDIIEDLD